MSKGEPSSESPSRGERRQRERLKVPLPVHVQPLDPEQKHLEGTGNTLNFNREGLYFTTRLNHYYVGMRLLVTIPYSSVTVVRMEYLCEVVRLDHLPNGCQGVAVRFLSSGGPSLPPRNNPHQ